MTDYRVDDDGRVWTNKGFEEDVTPCVWLELGAFWWGDFSEDRTFGGPNNGEPVWGPSLTLNAVIKVIRDFYRIEADKPEKIIILRCKPSHIKDPLTMNDLSDARRMALNDMADLDSTD